MKYKDLKKFYEAHYRVHISWNHLEDTLDEYNYRGELDLDPDFQRGHVWDEIKQREYVEYCVQGGRYSRLILFNHPNWMTTYKGEMVLVDGKQRLEAVRKFMRNELAIFGGNYLNDFEDVEIMKRASDLSFDFGINNLPTRKHVLEWYLQLNTGGVVHTQEEIDKVKKMLEEEK